MTMNAEVKEMLEVSTLAGPLARTAKRLRGRTPIVPSSDDPRVELRRLVQQHVALTKVSTANMNMGSDKKAKVDSPADAKVVIKKGDIIKCRLPEDAMVEVQGLAGILKKKAKTLETAMLHQLKQIPIYQLFLSKVFGIGPIVAAYLIGEIDITRATKPSNLKRFCGLAVIDGHLERPVPGQKNQYSKAMRMRIYQAMAAMWKNAAKKSAGAPHGSTTKYLTVWKNYVVRMQHSERVIERGVDAKGVWTGKVVNGQGKTVSARGFAHSTGWHKGADVLVDDLYMVWRAIEGLPIWPAYYAAKLGYSHGGKICVNAPTHLTPEEALELIGEVGATPLAAPAPDLGEPPMELEE